LPVDERERRAEQPERGRGAEGIARPQEERQYGQHGRRDAEPEGRLRRVLRVLPERELERRGEGQQHDQRVEAVPGGEVSEPAHALNVLQARADRLLPEEEAESSGGTTPNRASRR